jgi:hypothetical protein
MPDGRKPELGGWNRSVIEVQDFPFLAGRLQGTGAPFRNEIVVGPGGKQILMVDPDGQPVELFEPA